MIVGLLEGLLKGRIAAIEAKPVVYTGPFARLCKACCLRIAAVG